MPVWPRLRFAHSPDRLKILQALLVGGFLLFALYYALTALTRIYGFAWPQPTMDQFRLYAWYLELPLPDSILQRENGHRPVIPGLIRVLEIHTLAAIQNLQIAFGAFCAAATAGLMAGVAWRERSLTLPMRAAAFALAIIAVFWMANARMLLHGNELVHAYLLTLNVVPGALAVWWARLRPWAGMTLASICGVLATFCFGPGMALFPALIVTGFALRLPWRSLAPAMIALGLCLLLYLFVWPGDGEVRSGLRFVPLEIVTTATRWLASPWVNAWLGFAAPPLIPGSDESMLRQAPWLVSGANGLQQLSGLSWSYGLALVFGSLEWLVLVWALWRVLRPRRA